MALILHLGDGKCGSTAIQFALHQQRDALRRVGILYDTGPRRRDHFLLTTLLGNVTRSPAAGQAEYARRNLKSLSKQAGDFEHVMISSEALLSSKPVEVMDLLFHAGLATSDTRAIAYVRTPCSMYPSLIQQQLKGSRKFTAPDKYRRPINTFVREWQVALGVENLTLRLFDRDRLVGQDIVTDFSSFVEAALGAKLPTFSVTKANTSLSAEQLIVLQDIRRALPVDSDGFFHPESNRVLSLFASLNRSGIVGSPIKLDMCAEAAIHSNNVAIVEDLNRLAPYLCMTTGANYEVMDGKHEASWQTNCSVASVLRDIDNNIVNLLSTVVKSSISEPGLVQDPYFKLRTGYESP